MNARQTLAKIADAYDANELDGEARKRWGVRDEMTNTTPPDRILLYTGRGGGTLLTLQDCLNARMEMDYGRVIEAIKLGVANAFPFEQATTEVSYIIGELTKFGNCIVHLCGLCEYGEQRVEYKRVQFILITKRMDEDGYLERKVAYGLRQLRKALNLPVGEGRNEPVGSGYVGGAWKNADGLMKDRCRNKKFCELPVGHEGPCRALGY